MTALAIKRSAVIAFLHYLFLLGEMGYMRGVIEGYWKRVCRVCVRRPKKLPICKLTVKSIVRGTTRFLSIGHFVPGPRRRQYNLTIDWNSSLTPGLGLLALSYRKRCCYCKPEFRIDLDVFFRKKLISVAGQGGIDCRYVCSVSLYYSRQTT